jgi:thiol-disulfide isomerase/thioredoxin
MPMKKIAVTSLLLSVIFSLSFGQERVLVKTLEVPQLLQRINNQSDTLYVVNFWATWCTPCVAEIPEFNKITPQFNHRPVKVILVSLDFQGQKEKRIIPFIKANKISHTVVHLMTPRGGDWINRIDSSWSGAIPATLLVYQQSKRTFFEGQLDYSGIISLMEKTLKETNL